MKASRFFLVKQRNPQGIVRLVEVGLKYGCMDNNLRGQYRAGAPGERAEGGKMRTRGAGDRAPAGYQRCLWNITYERIYRD